MARLLRTSERTTFTSCRQKWWWAYEERLRPKVPGPALRFGTLVHKAMELRYPVGLKRGPHPAKTFEKLYEAELKEAMGFGFRDENGDWEDALDIGVKMLNAFVEEYGRDSRYRVIASEQTFRVKIARDLVYVGTCDGIWQDRQTGLIFLKEWKTAAQFWTKHLALDEQAGSYWAFLPIWLKSQKILPPGTKLRGILYTFMRRGKPDERPKNEYGQSLNKDGSISKQQPPPMFERQLVYRDKFDRDMIRARSLAQAEEMRGIREGTVPLYKNPSRFNCSGCPFLDPCELHETGADYRPLLRAGYELYNPYDAHHIYEEGK